MLRVRHRIPNWALCCLVAAFCTASVAMAQSDETAFEPSDDVKQVLTPLFSNIRKADVSRAKVELSVETVLHGEIVSKEQSTFQIASKYPGKYTIYQKSDDERKRVYSDGEVSTVAITPDAYFQLPEVIDCQSFVNRSPVQLGPYAEPLLALTLAGVDPSLTFLGGMKSVAVVDRTKFRGRVPAVHLRAQQDDGVTWDLWLSDSQDIRPLRLLINLTPMLIATGQVAVPQGYELSLRYDFLSWRISGEVEDQLFRFNPAPEAIEYESMQDYQAKMAGDLVRHPLLGKPAPAYTLSLIDGTMVDSESLKDKIVVLDFWATWCTPCLKAMPVIAEMATKYESEGIVFYAINAGENAALASGFAGEQDWGVNVAVDPKGVLMEAFTAKSIPLTLIISAKGIVEAAHIGFAGEDALAAQFKDEFEVLLQGGQIASTSESE